MKIVRPWVMLYCSHLIFLLIPWNHSHDACCELIFHLVWVNNPKISLWELHKENKAEAVVLHTTKYCPTLSTGFDAYCIIFNTLFYFHDCKSKTWTAWTGTTTDKHSFHFFFHYLRFMWSSSLRLPDLFKKMYLKDFASPLL